MNAFDALWCDEIPADAARLIEDFELATDEVRKTIEARSNQIRERADAEIAEIKRQGDGEIRERVSVLAGAIRPLLESYLKAGKLGETLAIRERLRRLRTEMMEVLHDPGLIHIAESAFGKEFLYDVTGGGANPGYTAVWGTDVYCGGSGLALACVHAGVLRQGERGVVRVIVLDKLHDSFAGSTRNGVTSFPYQGAYPAFRVSRA